MNHLTKIIKKVTSSSLEDFDRQYMIENSMTPAEKEVWKILESISARNTFKRHYSYRYFILDFYSEELKICIEIDSKNRYHNKQVDAIKKQILAENGIHQIILQADEVMKETEKIKTELKKRICE